MRKLYLLLIFLAIATGSIHAQISNLCFSASSGTFTPIVGGTPVTAIQADDANVQNIPIGFTFNYLGVNFTQASVSSNGWLSFTNANPNPGTSNFNTINTVNAALRNTLFPLWDDLDGTGGTATYLTTGTAGSQVFTMEWRNWSWDATTTNAIISFQVKLYEGSNIIEFVYRQEAAPVDNNSGGASIGLNDGTGGSGHYISLQDVSASPVLSSTTPFDGIGVKPATGQIYRFAPVTAAPTISSISPNPACVGSLVTINGINFLPCLTSVTFNGTPATTFSYVNPTTVTAIVPAGASTGPVQVTTPGGTGASPSNLTISQSPTSLTYDNPTANYCVGTAIINNTATHSGGIPTNYSISPSLPSGLNFDISSGTISGSPTVISGATVYTITASNSCGSTNTTVNITINNAPISLTYSTNPATYCAGVLITNNTPTNSGGSATSYSVSPALPAGLSLNAATGVISGTPTTTAGVAATTYTVTATNSCGSATVGVVITISPAAPTALNYTTTNPSYCVGTAIPANNPSNTGGAPSSYSVSPALPAGLSLNTSTGVITGTPTAITAAGNYTVTATNSCGSTTKVINITVNQAPSITYSTNPATYCAGVLITNNTPTNSGGPVTSYSVSPALPAGLSLSAASGVISGTPTATNGVATATYTVTATNGCGSATVGVIITISPAAPTALNYTTTNPSYCVGTAIPANNPSNTGGAPSSYSVSPALPAGLSLNTSTGVISGTPTAASPAANYTVTAQNSCGSSTKVINITVNRTPSITYSTNPATYCAGVLITNNTPTNSGGPVTSYSVSPALPAGLSLNAATGVISGTPTTTNGVATTTYTVTASNSCGSATVGVVITISPAAPTALNYTTTNPSYCVGTAIPANNPSNTGGAPSSYSVSPALPAGLTLNTSTGVITGTPTAITAAGNYTVTATNSCGSTTKVINITVNQAPSITYSTNPATYCAGVLITNNTPTNSGGPVTSYSVSPALPAGLSLSAASGVISGTPTATNGVATATYTVTATNGCGSTTVGVIITISPAAPTALNYTTTNPSYCVGHSHTCQ